MNLIHIWHRCHGCKMAPITGKRFHCSSCPDGPDNDLCETCFRDYSEERLQHPIPHSVGAMQTREHVFSEAQGLDPSQYDPWLMPAFNDAVAPMVRTGLLARPEFISGFTSTFAGYCFSMRYQERTLILTALHVMDEMIRKKNLNLRSDRVTGRELPAVIDKVNLYDVLAPNWMLALMGTTGPMLALPHARLGVPEPDSCGDIAAFDASGVSGLNPAEPAPDLPSIGETVWLAANLPPNRHLQRAVVVDCSDEGLFYRFEDPEEKVQYTSGAPILDGHGRVTAINTGGGQYRDHRFGHGNHINNILKHLDMAY